ncbi:MAG TPA: hypothetical protein ENH62_14870, partial [Marinobacter sp.]|nr:hypothetical protein [Marinobacter sp.]
MRRAAIVFLTLVMFVGCGRLNQVRIYEGGPGTKEAPAEPKWTVDNPPSKGEVVYERTTGTGDNKETLKVTVKKEQGGWNPFAYIGQLVANIVALVFKT